MKHLFLTTLLVLSGVLTRFAHAQSGPAFPELTPDRQKNTNAQAVKKSKQKPTASDIANMQRRMNMNPDEAKRDQQLELLEARAGTGNTSFGRANGPARQYEKSSGGFVVRKFKGSKISRNAMLKKGQSRPVVGIVDPKGKPLKHKRKHKKHFLLF